MQFLNSFWTIESPLLVHTMFRYRSIIWYKINSWIICLTLKWNAWCKKKLLQNSFIKTLGGDLQPLCFRQAMYTQLTFRRTAGDNRRSWGGKTHKWKTGGEEARGGERYARAGKVAEDMDLGRGNLGGVERGGDHSRQWTRVNNSKYRPESSVGVAAVRGLETTPPYNEHAIWAWRPDIKKDTINWINPVMSNSRSFVYSNTNGVLALTGLRIA